MASFLSCPVLAFPGKEGACRRLFWCLLFYPASSFCGLLGFCALQFAVVKDALGDASTPSLAPSANEGPNAEQPGSGRACATVKFYLRYL